VTTRSVEIPTGRLTSLDVFRGITIAGMILVNNPGSWSFVYPPLRHAEWHGWTPTDLIFPFFLFIVGVAMAFSLVVRLESGDDQSAIFLKVLKRSLIIIGVGLFLNAFPRFDILDMRYPGVLQRIGVVYFFASVIAMKTGVCVQAVTAISRHLSIGPCLEAIPGKTRGTQRACSAQFPRYQPRYLGC
jgi:predicted acyltransferase